VQWEFPFCYAAAMTRIAVASDLHIEFERPSEPGPPPVEDGVHPTDGPDLGAIHGAVDLLILAGDIDLGTFGIAYADEAARYLGVPVVYVLGNHEAYHGDLDAVLDGCRAAAAETGGRVLFLQNDAVEVAGVRVLGCTLWTDYAINGDAAAGMRDAAEGLADHRLIRTGGRRFMPADALVRHEESRGWLAGELAREAAGPVVVVTHHAPVRAAIEPRFEGSPLSPAFVSDLGHLIDTHAPAAWIWGHTHFSVDVTRRGTRCISAQRGYPGEHEAVVHFRPAVIEV
jgi:Icc-related predicted phosphoesterase